MLAPTPRTPHLCLAFIALLAIAPFPQIRAQTNVSMEIRNMVDSMDAKDLLAQKMIVGLPWLPRDKRYSPDARKDIDALADGLIGNLFVSDKVHEDWLRYAIPTERSSASIDRPERDRVRTHIQEWRRLMRDKGMPPPIVATDFEGGTVQHLRSDTIAPKATPSPMAFGAVRDGTGDRVHEFGKLVGATLTSLGFTTNFAPLSDLANETTASVIGTRSYSSDSSVTQALATKFALGLVSEGITPVLKHWPALGGPQGTLRTATVDRNWNLDVHFFEEPVPLNSMITTYAFHFSEILARQPFAAAPAVMSSHGKAVEYVDHCDVAADGVVSVCEKIVAREFRDELKQDNSVLVADDIAYLRAMHGRIEAMRGRMRQSGVLEDESSARALAELLEDIFESGHDLAIVASTVFGDPNPTGCDSNRNAFGCPKVLYDAMHLLRDSYLSSDEKMGRLKESVRRILNWKLLVYDRLGEGQGFLSGNWSYRLKQDDEESRVRRLRRMEELSRRVLQEAIMMIRPHKRPDAIRAHVGITHESRVFGVGPTYLTNDLKRALQAHKHDVAIVDSIDLSYHANDRRDPDRLIRNAVESIRSRLTEGNYDVLIFGLADIPAHMEIATRVALWIRSMKCDGECLRVVWVAFGSPTVLGGVPIGGRDVALATFSNSQISNEAVVDALFGRQVDVQNSTNSPVRILGSVDHVQPWRRGAGDEEGRVWASMLELLRGYYLSVVGMVVAVLMIKTVLGRSWWLASLCGLSGVVVYFGGAVVGGPLGGPVAIGGLIEVQLGSAIDFVGPMVLAFVMFALFKLLARAVKLDEVL